MNSFIFFSIIPFMYIIWKINNKHVLINKVKLVKSVDRRFFARKERNSTNFHKFLKLYENKKIVLGLIFFA